MTLETPRLTLIALDARQLSLWVNDLAALERELGCRYEAEPLEGHFLEIVKGQLAKTEADPDNYVWRSFWLLKRGDGKIVGSADFKAPPDENGETEIGYGLGEAFMGKGYMTEAVSAMCRWALSRDDVKAVIAETERDGFASQRALARCGFEPYNEDKTLWRLRG